MPLTKQNVVFPMAKGMDTKTDKKQLVTGKMELLQNAYLISPLQYRKRNGYESLAQIAYPDSIATFNEEAITFAENKVYTYSPGLGGVVPIKISSSPTTQVNYEWCQLETYRAIVNYENHVLCCSSYHSSGVQAFVSQDSSNGSWFTIIDFESKSTLYGPAQFSTSNVTAPKVYVIGGNFIVTYFTTTTLKYIAIPVNKTTGAFPSATTIATNYNNTDNGYDGTVFNSVLYIVWAISGNGIGIAKLDTALTLTTSVLPTADAVATTIAIYADVTTGRLSIAYYNGTDVKYLQCDILFNITSISVIVETVATVRTVVVIIDNNAGYVYYEAYSGVALPTGCFYNNSIKRSTITAGVPGAGAFWIRSIGIISKPFYVTINGEVVVCIMAGYTGHQPAAGQGCAFLLNTTGVVIGNLSPGNSFGIGGKSQGLSAAPLNVAAEVDTISTTEFTTSFLRAEFGYSEDGAQYSRYGVFGIKIDFDNLNNFESEVAASNLHVVSGRLQMYDGKDFVEQGFNIIAEPPISVTASHAGADNFPDSGTFSYVIVFEWIDSQGNFHQGVPSVVFTKTIVGPQTQMALVIPTLRITQKSNVFLSVYRNTLAVPTLFNRVETVPVTTQGNSLAADSITYNDITTDLAIAGHQQLYTTGGVVPNYCVPSPRIIAGYKNRLLVVPAETPNIIWISKEILQGIPGVPVEMSAFLTIQVNTLGGDMTAIEQMDDKAIVFKETTIFYFSGDGPNNTLTADDISEPTQIPTDCGCTNVRSVVLTPNGILFKSEKGIYLLDRSLGVTYIGAEVEAYNGDIILSAELVPNTQQVRFLLDSGIAIVYDYLMKEWFIYENHKGVAATIYSDLYTYLGDDGDILRETINSFSDNGEFIPMLMRTGWLSFTGIQGFQRVYKMELLGDYYSTHQLLVSLSYDFNTNVEQTVQFDPGTIFDNTVYGEATPYGNETPYGGEAGFPLEQFIVYPDIQKCESIQIQIEDISNGIDGESLSISSLAFEVGVEGGIMRLPATKKFG